MLARLEELGVLTPELARLRRRRRRDHRGDLPVSRRRLRAGDRLHRLRHAALPRGARAAGRARRCAVLLDRLVGRGRRRARRRDHRLGSRAAAGAGRRDALQAAARPSCAVSAGAAAGAADLGHGPPATAAVAPGSSGDSTSIAPSSPTCHQIVWRSAAAKPSWPSTVKKIVPSTATPIPPPSCCIAFSAPDAEPVSASVTARDDRLEHGHHEQAHAHPDDQQRTGSSQARCVAASRDEHRHGGVADASTRAPPAWISVRPPICAITGPRAARSARCRARTGPASAPRGSR